MRTLILSTFLYVCESWTLTAEIERRIQSLEMRSYRRLLNISYKKTCDEWGGSQQNPECNWSAWWSPNYGKETETQMVWPHLKILWHGEDNSARDSERSKKEKKRWEDNIKEWTGMGFGDSLRAAEDREGWKGIVATSSVVPWRPQRLGDWDEMS